MDVEVGLVISYQPGGNSSGGLWSPVQKESCRGLCGEKLTFMLGGDAGSGSEISREAGGAGSRCSSLHRSLQLCLRCPRGKAMSGAGENRGPGFWASSRPQSKFYSRSSGIELGSVGTLVEDPPGVSAGSGARIAGNRPRFAARAWSCAMCVCTVQRPDHAP